MRIVKPSWVTHGSKGNDLSAIFSIDIHPEGSKVATGGQGDDCGRVIIWNMLPIISEFDELHGKLPKLFCTIDSHLQCVNAVRWSNSGKYLASAGDDQLIMIWTLSGRHQGPGPIEQYRIVATLRSHSGDVLDLSWSHDDQMLASCSIDNMIVVWNTQRWPEIVTTLRGHSGMVKGVTWDPIGKYLASQSDDKTLRVWRVSDWSEEAVVTQPFEQCGGTTHVLRLSWAPDGQFIVTAQAMNNCGSVAKIVERQDWSSEKDFVGHRKAIPCVRCNSNLFKKKDDNNKEATKSKRQCVVALGSRDRSLSIWATAIPRPVLVLSDLFQNSVLDLSWSKSGYQLMACSNDGTVAYLEFTEEELGLAYSEEERFQHLQQLYGNSIGNKGSFIYNLIEDMDIMMLHRTGNGKQNGDGVVAGDDIPKNVTNAAGANTNSSPVAGSSPKVSQPGTPGMRLAKGPTDKQIEILQANGRRRIIPLFIPPTGDTPITSTPISEISAAASSSQPASFSSSSESKSKIVIETRDESNPPIEYMSYYNTQITANGTTTNIAMVKQDGFSNADEVSARDVVKDQLQTESNGGEKKVPIMSQPNLEESSSSPKPQTVTTNGTCKSSARRIESGSESSNDEIIIRRTKASSVKRKSVDNNQPVASIPIKRKPGRPPGSGSNQSKNNENSKHSQPQLEPNSIKTSTITAEPSQSVHSFSTAWTNDNLLSNRTANPMNATRTTYFPPLKLSKQSKASIKLFTCSESKKVYTAQLENPLSSSSFSRLTLLKDDQPMWNVLLSSSILALSANQHILASLCDDNSLHIFNTTTGCRIYVPIIIESKAARMVCSNKSHLMIITCNANIWLWDVLMPKVLVKGESLLPILIHAKTSEQLSILNAGVTPSAKPIVSISNGRTYIFECDLASWCLIADSNDPLNACTDLKPSSISSLRDILTISTIPSRSLLNYFSANIQIAQHGLISFIELQIEASKVLESGKDYRYWVMILVQNLVSMHLTGFNADNIEVRLRDLCNFLLGQQFPGPAKNESTASDLISSTPLPTSKKSANAYTGNITSIRNSSNKIIGLNKHELLREILSVLASNLSLQRLYVEFKEQLESFNSPVSFNSTYLNTTRVKPHCGSEAT